MKADSPRARLEALTAELEFRRCARDKEYFIETYWHIESELHTGGRVQFRLWDFQRDTLATLLEELRVVIGKVRQVGMTTLVMADSFHEMFFHGPYRLLFVSKKEDDAKGALRQLAVGYNALPDWMKERGPKRDGAAAGRFGLVSGDGAESFAVAMAGTENVGASATWSRVVLDEYALNRYAAKTWQSAGPAGAAAVRAAETAEERGVRRRSAPFVLISTFRGSKNLFAKRFWGAWRGEMPGWKAVFWPCTKNQFLAGPEPARAAERVIDLREHGEEPSEELLAEAEVFWEAWRNERTSYETAAEFFSEYPRSPEEASRESGNRRFPHIPDLAECAPFEFHGWLHKDGSGFRFVEANDETDALEAPFHFRVHPDDIPRKGRVFVLAADPASGVEKDYSVAFIGAHCVGEDGSVDWSRKEILGMYRSNRADGIEFADRLFELGRFLHGTDQREALLAPERVSNQIGDVLTRLRARGYANLFRYVAQDRVTVRSAPTLGWPIDRATKPEALAALARCFTVELGDDGNETVTSTLEGIPPEMHDELDGYVIKRLPSGREEYGADSDGHDDTVMCAAIYAAVLERVRAQYERVGVRRQASRPGQSIEVPENGEVLELFGFDPAKHKSQLIAAGEQRREGDGQWRQKLRNERLENARTARRS